MTSYVTPGTVSIKAENEAVMKTFCQNVYVLVVSAEEYMALNTVKHSTGNHLFKHCFKGPVCKKADF